MYQCKFILAVNVLITVYALQLTLTAVDDTSIILDLNVYTLHGLDEKCIQDMHK
jgi:hypothetical protein